MLIFCLIFSFSELYETAVQNILNIKALSCDLANETTPSPSYSDIDKPFRRYLDKTVDLEKDTINELSQYYYGERKRSYDGEPSYKNQPFEKLVSQFPPSVVNQTIKKAQPDESSVPVSYYSQLFDFKSELKSETTTTNSNASKIQKKHSEVDNKNFFSQFLSDQATHNQARPYFSHADFPWLHPSHFYDQHYRYSLPYYYYGEQQDRQSVINGYTKSHPIDDQIKESKSHAPNEHFHKSRMTLNTIKREKDPLLQESKKEEIVDVMEAISPDEEVKKITKIKKVSYKIKSSGKCTPSQERKNKIKESLKYRPYSLRQRVKASKKAKKLAAEMKKPPAPKYILKDLNVKTSTRKEMFLGQLGLRKILKRIDRKELPEKDK